MFIKYISEVSQEFKKIVWPSWPETKVTTILILIFALIMAIFLFVVDQFMLKLISLIIGR